MALVIGIGIQNFHEGPAVSMPLRREEVVPKSQYGGNADLATMGAMISFAIMMVLDIALG